VTGSPGRRALGMLFGVGYESEPAKPPERDGYSVTRRAMAGLLGVQLTGRARPGLRLLPQTPTRASYPTEAAGDDTVTFLPPGWPWSSRANDSQGSGGRHPTLILAGLVILIAAVIVGAAVLREEFLSGLRTTPIPPIASASVPAPSPRPSVHPTGPPPTRPERTVVIGAEVTAISFGPSGETFAAGDSSGITRLWNTADWQAIKSLDDADSGASATQGVNALAFNPNGRILAVGDQNGFTYVWDADGQEEYPAVQDVETEGGVGAVAFSPDGHLLVTGDGNGLVNIWNAATGASVGTLRTPDGAPVTTLSFTLDGALLAVGDSTGTTWLWNTAKWSDTSVMPTEVDSPDTQRVNAVAFSKDDEYLAIAGNGGSINVWSLRTHTFVNIFHDPDSKGVLSVEFSADGRYLAAGDANGRIYLWTHSLAAVFTDPGSHGVNAVAFSPDSTTLAVGDANGNCYLWSMRWGSN
jgi:WD40 repeat protein